MLPKGSEIVLDIEDLAFGGRGVARAGGFVVLVPSVLPGQKIRARIVKTKKRYAEAQPVEILSRSPFEIRGEQQPTPGAPWIFLPLELQRQYKLKQTFKLFADFGALDVAPLFDDFVVSPLEYDYRNKMDYSFGITSNEGTEKPEDFFGLGFRQRGSHYLVENLRKPSGIFDRRFEQCIPPILDECRKTGAPPYGFRKNRGFFRYLRVRKSFRRDTFSVALVHTSSHAGEFDAERFERFLGNLLGERLAGFSAFEYDHCSDAFLNDCRPYRSSGETDVVENVGGLEFLVPANAFFQTNSLCCRKLYEKVAEYCEGERFDEGIDLYSGIGSIALSLARRFPDLPLTGVELVPAAVEAALRNARTNGIDSVRWVCEDVRKFLKKYGGKAEKALLVLDPPRSGMAPKALERVLKLAPSRIVYVSCNPATMARDSKVIVEAGYAMERISLVDQFPHTHHVEAVALFRKP